VGEVVAFKPRFGRPSSSSPAPASPTALTPARPKRSLRDVWSDPANWQISRKGNPFMIFRRFGEQQTQGP
jgi:hypothetical protein